MDASRNSLFSNFSYISPLNAQMNEEIPFTFQQIRCSYTIFKSKFCVYIKGRYPRNHVDKQEKVCLNQLIFLLQTNLEEISQLFQIVPQKRRNLRLNWFQNEKNNQKRSYEPLGFSVLRFEISANRFSIKFCIRKFTYWY